MDRYQIEHLPAQKDIFLVLDNSLDGYIIAECDTVEEADAFMKLRYSQDVIHSSQ